MKSISYLIFFSAVLVLLSGCDPAIRDYSSAENIDVKWELISNITDEDGVFRARFILENQSDVVLSDNWKLFFTALSRLLLRPSAVQAAAVEHINGSWYQLTPRAGFSLKPDESIEVAYRGYSNMIKTCDGPAGVYFVFYHENGREKQIVEVDCGILPFTRPEQINRSAEDLVPVPSPDYRYHNNRELHQISEKELLKIIPSPAKMVMQDGSVTVDADWAIAYDNGLQNEAGYLSAKLRSFTGLALKTQKSSTAQREIVLKTGDIEVNGIRHEAYDLSITGKGIEVIGGDEAGVFYGIQSLLALIPSQTVKNRPGHFEFERLFVRDAPRFGYRGLHVDVARNFQEKETILKILDIISFYKLNKLYIYLSDDEGWRLEIPGLPELTEVGSQRRHTRSIQDAVLHPAYGSGPYPYSENTHGSGFLSRSDFIGILKCAKERHITVIPGINAPGHARAAIKSMEARFDRLMAEGKVKEAGEYRLADPGDTSVYLSAQLFRDNVISIAGESPYRFYKKVIDEIALMYDEAGLKLTDIHTGGDEVPEGAWAGSPLAAGILKDNPSYKDPKNLQAWFFKKLLITLKEGNYRIHGWEEVSLLKNPDGTYRVNPGFAGKNVIPHVWNNVYEYGNMDIAYRIANAGYHVVLCPATNFYLDDAYDKDPLEPGAYWSGFTCTRRSLTFAPFDMFKTTTSTSYGRDIGEKEYTGLERLKPESRKNILGLQAQLWGEEIKGRDDIEYRMFPKMLGFVERAWAGEREWETIEDKAVREKVIDREWNIFANTLARKELPRLSYLNGGYNYRLPLPGAIIENGILHANIEFPGLELRYTIDGSEPDVNSTKYEAPVKVDGNVKMKAFDSSGKSSRTAVVYYKPAG